MLLWIQASVMKVRLNITIYVLFQVNISQADMQAIGNTITMVTQDGTTITVPAHDAVISSAGTHSVAMVTADGTEGQQVKSQQMYLYVEKAQGGVTDIIFKRIFQPVQLNLWTICRFSI